MNRKIYFFIYLLFLCNIAYGLSCICSICDEQISKTCEVEPTGKCFTLKYDLENSHQHLIFGCATKENNVPQLANFVSPLHPRAIDYCDDEDFCNNNLQPLLHITSDSSTNYKFLIGCLFGSLSVFLVVLSYSSLYQFRLHSARDTNDILEVNFDKYPPTKDERFKDYPRAIELISKGKFSEVWKAAYKGEYVAVKVCYSIANEVDCELRRNLQMVHKNILRIIGSEKALITKPRMSCGHLIITAYHANRDLSTFLHTNVLDLRTMINMAYDISSGMNYLHSLPSVRINKLQMEHVYLESRNILVKDDLTCCIGDFGGLGIPQTFYYRRPHHVRYLAPELLMLTGCDPYIDSYSVSLVFWEMARRCNACGIPKEYRMPYFKDVSSDPSKEEMIDVVCTRGIRPLIEPRWLTNKILSEFVYLMTANWQLEPTNRMASSHIKRKLAKLRVVLGKSSWLSLLQ